MNDTKKSVVKRRKSADIRKDNLQLILTVAEQRFAEYGYNGTTISSIAEQANLPKSNILYYFKTKEVLYKEVLSQILKIWMVDMEEMTAEQHPKEALRHYILLKIRQSKDHSNASRIFASELLHGAPFLRDKLQTDLKIQFISTCQVIREWIAKQWMNPISPEHLLFMIWSSTQAYADYGLQSSILMGKAELDDDDFETGAELITQIVLRGCGIKQL
ncbi:TetR family transcriptional regulator C-terminal domain-containing protein [Psychromonas sp. 14N.309.X.WAT.B.A12]|uniref:TetR family transcriptional regulator C-terminal domain-containing protein n=1 Tax=unclassified Psychromonas TaxID=2614957 RepID=UPI0025AF0631|nr:TetR family transcriptional regulator C-terminal domain-containing protein [Psychromonas sp. 14N.309.X.WAT.B.A12]MDN2663601.1 TetR family transcriptional regulator C-terminal domain-containing protein [Psychromonas sp. 14N.309.X.WAT.B.A12]